MEKRVNYTNDDSWDRFLAFLGERLFSLYVFHNKKKVREVPMLVVKIPDNHDYDLLYLCYRYNYNQDAMPNICISKYNKNVKNLYNVVKEKNFIYGAGAYGQALARLLLHLNISFSVFIVSKKYVDEV